MTDNEIIKALENCCDRNTSCRDCPCFESPEGCVTQTDYLDLLKRQRAEIERLKANLEAKSNDWLIRDIPQEQLDEERKEAIKEGMIQLFKAKLKENVYNVYIGDNKPIRVVQEATIDRIARELMKAVQSND